jgi:hypothetical protein
MSEKPIFRPLQSVEVMNAKLTEQEKHSFLYMDLDQEQLPDNIIPFPSKEEPEDIVA